MTFQKGHNLYPKERPDTAERNKILKAKEGIGKRITIRFDSENTAAKCREIFKDVIINNDDLEELQALFLKEKND